MKDIIFIGGLYNDTYLSDVASFSYGKTDFAANLFQKRILKGFIKLNVPIKIISAPFISPYPFSSKKIFFRGFPKDDLGVNYLPFCNIFGIKNYSREQIVYKALEHICKSSQKERLIIVYAPHTPFLRAAVKAKNNFSKVKICLIIPDLPQYMNLTEKKPLYYKIAKRIDIKLFNNALKNVDSYIVLTQQMISYLNIQNRPNKVIEGIIETDQFAESNNYYSNKDIKTIVYTGTLNKSFGVLNLIDAFMNISDDSLRLCICGTGETAEQIKLLSEQDKRIDFLGMVSPNKAKEIINKADILVNPRQNTSEYTKYSFPSKIIEYLQTGKPVIAYKLDGMPEIYNSFIYFVENNSINALSKKIIEVLNLNPEKVKSKSSEAIDYIKQNLRNDVFVKKLLNLNEIYL